MGPSVEEAVAHSPQDSISASSSRRPLRLALLESTVQIPSSLLNDQKIIEESRIFFQNGCSNFANVEKA